MQQYRCTLIVLFASFSSLFAGFAQSNIPYFKSGDIICFLGDSITHGGQYHEFLQLFYATRYPEVTLSFHNCGISGDNASGMLARFEEDVLKHKPTHVFLMTGMNDVNRNLYFDGTASDKLLNQRAAALKNYKKQTALLVAKIKAYQVVPILLTPTIYDQYSKIEKENNMGCNDALIACSNHIKKLGDKYDALVIDLNTPMKELMERELKKDSLFTVIGKDRVHPGPMGNFIMFNQIIATLEPETMLSKIAIDLHNNQHLILAEHATLRNVQLSDSLISFQAHEYSLPFPVSNHLGKALSLTSFTEIYNRQMFQVEGLRGGVYKLFIENVFIGRFSSQELGNGVNLAKKANTPQYKKAKAIRELCAAYRKTEFQLRTVAHIKYTFLKDYKGKDDVALVKKHLDRKLKKINGKPYYEYIKNSMDTYFEILPKVDSLEKKKERIKTLMQLENITSPHEWVLSTTL